MKYGIILLVIILSFRPLAPLLDYGINYDYISTVLCINKDKPELNCNGKCHLIEEIAEKSAENIPENTQNGTFKIIDAFIVQEKYNVAFKYSVQTFINNNFFYNNLYSYLSCVSFLKPPVV
ncbi:MAG: hypothetical protein LBP34_08110 [Flavobacteriaceae bacterium]|jgi:hypothetical protein|nr:hypothetical protein [Flavobacteriaceae bacterium]